MPQLSQSVAENVDSERETLVRIFTISPKQKQNQKIAEFTGFCCSFI